MDQESLHFSEDGLWNPLTEDGFHGYVHSVEDLGKLLQSFEIKTSTHFVKWTTPSKRYKLGTKELPESYRIRFHDIKQTDVGWQPTVPYDGIPFVILGKVEYVCHFGPDKHKRDKQRRIEQISLEDKGDHPKSTKRRQSLQSSKKKDCTAKFVVKEVMKFPDFQVERPSQKARKLKSEALRCALEKGPVKQVCQLLMHLPKLSDHTNHQVGELTALKNPVSKEIREKISELVTEGVDTVSEMRRHLQIFIDTVLFKGKTKPAVTNNAYYPSKEAIRSHIYLAQLRLRTDCEESGKTFQNEMEIHVKQLAHRCRICGKNVDKEKTNRATNKKNHTQEILEIFGIDLDEDDEQVHPQCICRSHELLLQRYARSKKDGLPFTSMVKASSFVPHINEECEVCKPKKRGRKRKRIQSKERTFSLPSPEASITNSSHVDEDQNRNNVEENTAKQRIRPDTHTTIIEKVKGLAEVERTLFLQLLPNSLSETDCAALAQSIRTAQHMNK